MTAKLIAERRGQIGYLVLNAPERRNALSLDMWQAIPGHIKNFDHNPGISCLVITGAGTQAFAAGADISEFEANRADATAAKIYDDATRAAASAIMQCRKPVVAAIRGACFGGGMALAIACDLRIAAADARFCIPAAKLGIAYGYGGTATLVEKLGSALTAEMLYTARVYLAEEALLRGLIHHCVPVQEFDNFVAAYTGAIAANAPLSIASAKLTIQAIVSGSTALRTAADESAAACMESRDYAEGRQAFLEKRKPDFRGN